MAQNENKNSILDINLETKSETNPEVQSYIYQQIAEFEPFITPETLVMVVTRDPHYVVDENSEEIIEVTEKYNHRIAIILKEDEASIEAEAFHDDIYEAIKNAKEALLQRLIEIQEEIQGPKERMKAIENAKSSNEQIH